MHSEIDRNAGPLTAFERVSMKCCARRAGLLLVHDPRIWTIATHWIIEKLLARPEDIAQISSVLPRESVAGFRGKCEPRSEGSTNDSVVSETIVGIRDPETTSTSQGAAVICANRG
jgi:hypothetical protein